VTFIEEFGKELKENFNLLIEENQKLKGNSVENEKRINKFKENEENL
jgi:hypothetical protein